MRRKWRYAGHVLRGSSGTSHLQIIEGKMVGKPKVGRIKRTLLKDICEWTGLGTYEKVKRTAEERKEWKRTVASLRLNGKVRSINEL